MTRALVVELVRTVKKTFGKFVTLLLMVALGVAFFVGVSASAPVMSASADKYADDNGLMDIMLVSNYGFDAEDKAKLERVDDVERVELRKMIDVRAHDHASTLVTRVIGYSAGDQINRFKLVDGRMPTNKNECLAEMMHSKMMNVLPLGGHPTFTRPQDDLADFLTVNSCTVVGTVRTPEYLNTQKGYSGLSNATLSTFVFIPDDAFTKPEGMAAVLWIRGARELDHYQDAYGKLSERMVAKLESLAATYATERYEKLHTEALGKYNDGLAEYNDGKQKLHDETVSAQAKIDDGQAAYDEGVSKLEEAQQEIDQGERDLAEQREKALDELARGQQQYDAGLAAWTAENDTFTRVTKPGLIAQRQQLQGQVTQLETAATGIRQLEEGLASVNEGIAALEAIPVLSPELEAQLAALTTQLAQLNAQLDGAWAQLAPSGITTHDQLEAASQAARGGIQQITAGIATGEKKLAHAKQDLAAAEAKLATGRKQLDQQTRLAEAKLAQGRQKVASGRDSLATALDEINDGKQKLADETATAQAKLDDAWKDLASAKEKIDSMEAGSWTVLGRDKQYATKTYTDTVAQMVGIASVFPVFFLLVAGLVCLTTMTRMVDEQRSQIGTLRSLGYSKPACLLKYLAYAGSATLLGGIIGTIGGLALFPPVISNAWGMMYNLPEMVLYVPWLLVLGANAVFVAAMLATTYAVARGIMREIPSELLRPKAPPAGKRILVERFAFIWKRLSFSSKITMRNLFRYKKRFWMTVLGISGCTALLLSGFGIRTSITTIVDTQYSVLNKYQVSVQLTPGISVEDARRVERELLKIDGVKVAQVDGYYAAKAEANGHDTVVGVSVFSDNAAAEKMFELRTRVGHRHLNLTSDGILISEKLAESLHVRVGDTIALENKNEKSKPVVVAGIFEHYVMHQVVIDDEYYAQVFGESAPHEAIMLQTDQYSDQLAQDLAKVKLVNNISFTQPLIDSYKQMVAGLDSIVIVLIASAAVLAVIVLVSLTTVNISERQREIATLKVLGFRRREVNAYIFHENMFMVAFGSVLGLALGAALHQFIIRSVEMEAIMFGRTVSVMDIVLSVVLTIAFAGLINLMIRPMLAKITMVESLKSVE